MTPIAIETSGPAIAIRNSEPALTKRLLNCVTPPKSQSVIPSISTPSRRAVHACPSSCSSTDTRKRTAPATPIARYVPCDSPGSWAGKTPSESVQTSRARITSQLQLSRTSTPPKRPSVTFPFMFSSSRFVGERGGGASPTRRRPGALLGRLRLAPLSRALDVSFEEALASDRDDELGNSTHEREGRDQCEQDEGPATRLREHHDTEENPDEAREHEHRAIPGVEREPEGAADGDDADREGVRADRVEERERGKVRLHEAEHADGDAHEAPEDEPAATLPDEPAEHPAERDDTADRGVDAEDDRQRPQADAGPHDDDNAEGEREDTVDPECPAHPVDLLVRRLLGTFQNRIHR